MSQTNGSLKRTRPPSASRKQQSLAARVQELTALTSRLALFGRLGMSHQGLRDIYKTLGYPEEVTSEAMLQQWTRHDMARAIVDRPVKSTWQGDVFISEPDIDDESELEGAYKELDEELGLKSKFARLDRLSQLGKYAVMLLGFDDSSQQTWAQPVEQGDRELRYTRVVSEKNAEISSWETDPTNPRFGLPRLYKIKLAQPGSTAKDSFTSITVHYSRVIHVAADLLEDEVEGEPKMVTAFNRLKDLEKLVGGSAEMYWRGARPGYSGKADEGYKIGKDTKEKLMEQLDEYEHDLRRFIVSEGVDLQSLEQQIADPEGHVRIQIQMLSALTGIPMRILIGSERGELASSQDQETWKEWVQARRQEEAEPNILRPFVDRMLLYKVLPEPKDPTAGYSVIWSDLFTLGDKEKAEVGKGRAQALQNYAKEPMAEQMVPVEAFLKFFLKMEEDEVAQIISIQEAELGRMIREEDELESNPEGEESNSE